MDKQAVQIKILKRSGAFEIVTPTPLCYEQKIVIGFHGIYRRTYTKKSV